MGIEYNDLRDYIRVLEQADWLRKVDGADWNLEVGTLCEINSERNGPALLFDKLKDYPEGYRILTNCIFKPKKVQRIAFGIPDEMSDMEIISDWKDRLQNYSPVPPVEMNTGPILENVLTGDDVNPVKPDGLFSHLIALRDAMLADDDQAIENMDNAIQADRVNISNYRGVAGATLQAVEDRRDHTEDNILATKTLRSDIRDIDFTEANTKYQNLYTALQGNLMTGNQLTNVSLLDFLI